MLSIKNELIKAFKSQKDPKLQQAPKNHYFKKLAKEKTSLLIQKENKKYLGL